MSDKKLKKYLVRYVIGLVLFLALSSGFGMLCYNREMLPQGLVIIGAVFALGTIGFALIVLEHKSRKDMLAMCAGKALVSCDCTCSIKNRRGFNCLFVLCSDGLIIDGGGDSNLFVVSYSSIENYEITAFDVTLWTDQGEFRVICRKPIKLKAASDMLMKKVGPVEHKADKFLE